MQDSAAGLEPAEASAIPTPHSHSPNDDFDFRGWPEDLLPPEQMVVPQSMAFENVVNDFEDRATSSEEGAPDTMGLSDWFSYINQVVAPSESSDKFDGGM